MKSRDRYLILLAYGSLFCFGLIDNIRGPYLPEVIQDLSLSGTSSSMYFALSSLAAFTGSLISPWLLHRGSAATLLLWSNLLFGVAFAALSQAPNLPLLLTCAIGLGLGFGTLNLAQNVLVHEAAPARLRRRLFSGLHSMYGASAMCAPLTASLCRWLELTWRSSFLLISLLPVVVALCALPFRGGSALSHEEKQSARLNRSDWRAALGVAFIASCYLLGEISVSTRMVLWLRSERGFLPDAANLYLAAFCVLLLGGRVAFTLYHFSLSNENVLRISAILSALFYGLGLAVAPEFVVLSGLTMAPFYPVIMDYVTERFGRKSSSAMSLVLAFGSLSVVVMHAALGVISDWKSLSYALWMGPVGLAMIGVFFWPWCFSSQRVTAK